MRLQPTDYLVALVATLLIETLVVGFWWVGVNYFPTFAYMDMYWNICCGVLAVKWLILTPLKMVEFKLGGMSDG